jgi:glyoxylase-like metal-dependent hydrolase (beta-lactamase superfamily II)
MKLSDQFYLENLSEREELLDTIEAIVKELGVTEVNTHMDFDHTMNLKEVKWEAEKECVMMHLQPIAGESFWEYLHREYVTNEDLLSVLIALEDAEFEQDRRTIEGNENNS